MKKCSWPPVNVFLKKICNDSCISDLFILQYFMKEQYKYLAAGLAMNYLGQMSAQFSGMWVRNPQTWQWYQGLVQPHWAPPSYVFPVVWTVLYGLIGVVGVRLYGFPSSSTASPTVSSTTLPADLLAIKKLRSLFWINIGFNLAWSPVFFRGFLWFSWGIIVGILFTSIEVLRRLYSQDKTSFFLWLPYMLWSLYATALSTWMTLHNGL